MGISRAAVFLVAMLVGLLPGAIGHRVDPYDAYSSQFQPTTEPQAVAEHARLLGLYCLPRMIAGKELDELDQALKTIFSVASDPAASSRARIRWNLLTTSSWLAVLIIGGFLIALVRLARDTARHADRPCAAISGGTLASALLITFAFLVNRNIYNSDNYRYLIFVLTPWALGFGLVMNDLTRRGWVGQLSAWMISGLFVAVMTWGTFLWYREDRHYIDRWGVPVRIAHRDWSKLTVVPDEPRGWPAVPSDFVVPADVSHVFGGYWDVYRMAFMSGGRVVGIPLPIYPNRFRGWSRGLGPGQGKLLFVLPLTSSSKPGSVPIDERPSGIVQSAKRVYWQHALATAWIADGRDPAELSRLEVVIP
jgi:hypothetical protein